jgi:type IV pilus modification protein PilV
MKTLRNEGFTLLEVLIAVAVLAFGLLAVAQMQVIAIRFNYQARDTSQATTLALDELERLKSLPYTHADLQDDGDATDLSDDGDDEDLTDSGDPDHPNMADTTYPFRIDAEGYPLDPPANTTGYGIFWNVADRNPNTGNKAVMMTVSWLSGPNRVKKHVEISTVIGD